MTTMVVAVIVTLLSMFSYHQRCNNHPVIPPLLSCLLLPEKGGGLNSDLTGMREEDGPFPPSHPLTSPFPSLPSPPLSLGHLRQ